MSSTALIISAAALIAVVFLFSLYMLRRKEKLDAFEALADKMQNE
jgi:hypothetical protein